MCACLLADVVQLLDLRCARSTVEQFRIYVADEETNRNAEPNIPSLSGLQVQAQGARHFRDGGDLVVAGWTIDVEEPARYGAADDIAVDLHRGLNGGAEDRRAIDEDAPVVRGERRQAALHLRELRTAGTRGEQE